MGEDVDRKLMTGTERQKRLQRWRGMKQIYRESLGKRLCHPSKVTERVLCHLLSLAGCSASEL